MGTKVLERSATELFAARFLTLVLVCSSFGIAMSPRRAAADEKKARNKIVDLNKQALLSYEAKDFETAKDLLMKALKEAKQAGLEEDKMTARTYVHLGAVSWVGFQDQAAAVQNFTLAKKIRPDIQLTPSIETPDLRTVFELAAVDAEPSTAPEPATKPVSRPAPSRGEGGGQDEGGEPELPTSMAAPLMCTVPEEVPAGRELSLRCAAKPGLNVKGVQFHYRLTGAETFQAQPMKRTPKGWYVVMLPGHALKGKSLQVYFEAQDTADKVVATNGQAESPSVIEIRKQATSRAGSGDNDEDPMKKIREQQRDEAFEAGLHRRREGAIWFGIGGGLGFGWAPAGNLEWERYIKVSAVTAPTGQFHILPEVGYMVSDGLGLALQGRVEFIHQQQLSSGPSGVPATMAAAAFGRAIFYQDVGDGNFQLSLSGDLGGGYVRIPVKPVLVQRRNATTGDLEADPNLTIAKTDTRAIGPVLFGATGGCIYHISRHFALALDIRVLSGLGNFGGVIEGALSAQLAFGGKAGPAKPATEGEGEGDNAPAEQPLPSDSPETSEPSSEE
jgi:hypothetical protein